MGNGEFSKISQMGAKRKKKKKVYKDKGTEQRDMLIEIWAEREHISELSGQHLGDDMSVWFFAHILPKGTYPDMKLNKDNIMLLTPEEHYRVDHETHLAKLEPLYKPFFDKFDELKVSIHGT